MSTLLKTLRARQKRARVAVVGVGKIRSLSLELDADYVGVMPEIGPEAWYFARANTVRIHGSLTGPGLILITIEKLDFDYLVETNQLKWDSYTTVVARTPLLGGEFSVEQSFPAYWSVPAGVPGYQYGAYRLKASTYPFGLVVTPKVCLECTAVTAERVA